MYDDFEKDQRQRGESMLLGPLEQARPDLLFNEHDRRQAHTAIKELQISLTFYERLYDQATLGDSHQAKFLLNAFMQANRDNVPGGSTQGPATLFDI